MVIARFASAASVTLLSLTLAFAADAGETTATIHALTADGPGEVVGQVRFRDHEHGLLISPDLEGLGPGPHGAHIHENPDCGPAKKHGKTVPGGAAGGHFDPKGAGSHQGPYGKGHLGDLPNLIVEKDGSARIPVVAPRVAVSDIRNRALMIHAGADRYMDHGSHGHGKGGMRMYCGVID